MKHLHTTLTQQPARIIAAVMVLLALAPGLPASENHSMAVLQPYQAEYEARSSGLSAIALRTLERVEDQHYRLSNSLSLRVLGVSVGEVMERSEFSMEQDLLRPLNYSYRQSGVSRRVEETVFDWAALNATTIEDGDSAELPISAGVLDKLNFSVRLSLDLAALLVEQRQAGRQFTYQIVDEDEIEEHRYVISAQEVVETGIGALDALRIERQRDSESRRRTTFWLAPEHGFLLIKLEQVSSSGSLTELLLQKIEARP